MNQETHKKSTGTSPLVYVPLQHSAGTTLLSPDVRSQEQAQTQAQTVGNLDVATLVQALERNNIPQQQVANSNLLFSPALTTVDTSQLSAALSATNDPRLGTVAILQNNPLTNQLAVNNAIQALVQQQTQSQLLHNLILQKKQESVLANQTLIASLSNNLLTAAQAPKVFAQIVNPLQLAVAPTSLLNNLVTPIVAAGTAGAPSSSTNTQESIEAASTAASLPEAESSPKETLLYLPMDDGHLTEYQVLMRKQIVIARADEHDIQEDTQGRRVPLALGQASIQCRHCKHKPFRQRGKGSVYYPTSLDRLYQTCQNMSNIHLRKTCTCIDEEIRQQLNVLCSIRGRAIEGKEYWADGGKKLGLHESKGALYWRNDEKD